MALESRRLATMSQLRESFVSVNGIKLHVVEAGPSDGELVVLLHGFPEFWYSWRRQIDVLAAAGYRVLAPDQRGYNTSDKPQAVSAYSIDTLADDVAELIKSTGRTQANVVGHDWGAAVAWWLAIQHPQLVKRLSILNLPHPKVLTRALTRSGRQLLKSWYAFSFLLPKIPEFLLSWRGHRLAERALVKTSRRGTFTADELTKYHAAWAQPGAPRAMINWYRAGFSNRPKLSGVAARVKAPTLMIWGARDAFLGRELAQPSIDYCEKGELVFLEKATHWVHQEEPEKVNKLLLDFFA